MDTLPVACDNFFKDGFLIIRSFSKRCPDRNLEPGSLSKFDPRD
jgi:hypothetical protein